jgi:hypothetical protein
MMTAASVPLLLVACNNIVGLTDYKKAECNGGGDCLFDGSPGLDGNSVDGGGDVNAPDVVTVDANGAAPVSWAAWPMPNYDGGPNNQPAYAKAGNIDGGVVDTVTKLTWRPVLASDPKDVDFAAATAFCKGAAGANWRLPSRIELVSLIDVGPGKVAPYAAPGFGITANVYWTSSVVRTLNPVTSAVEITASYYGVGFDGASSNLVKQLDTSAAVDQSARVICVAAQ